MQEFATFGQWLKHQRKSQGFTQSALAERINCAVVTLRKIESNDLRPSQQMVQRILTELAIPTAAQTDLLALARNEQALKRTNLPTPLTRLIGREYELGRALQSLRSGTRLVSIVGSPGVGKSRLSLQIASECRAFYPNGCYYLDCAQLQQVADFIPALANLFHIELSGKHDKLHTLVQALSGSNMLLVLDHSEYLLGIASIVGHLLQHLPGLSMLISSRSRLRIMGEQVLQVPPLALPSQQQLQNSTSLEELYHVPAIALFAERVQSHAAHFELNKRNIHIVVNICMQLDGNPLAIELAAAWVTIFSLPQLLQRLKGSLTLLSQPTSAQQGDGRTMRSCIEASYQRLEAQEQELLQALAIFPHGCTLDAAIAMMDNANDSHAICHTTNPLARLLDHNLLYQQSSGEGELRFAIYEPIRIFALEQVEQQKKLLDLQQRQNSFFIGLAEQLRHDLHGPQQAELLQRLAQENANLQAILIRESGPTGDPQVILGLCSALWRLWELQYQSYEGHNWLSIALDLSQPADSALRADLLCGAAHFAYQLGDEVQAKQLLDQAIQICRSLGLTHLEVEALGLMGRIASQRSEFELAYTLFQNALQLLNNKPNPQLEAQILNAFVRLAPVMEEQEEFAAYFSTSIKLCRELGGYFLLGQALLAQARYSLYRCDYAQAAPALHEALDHFQTIENWYGEGQSYRYLLELSLLQNQLSKAQNFLYQAQSIFQQHPNQHQEAWLRLHEGQLAQLLGDTHTASACYQSALSQAQQLNERDLRAYALYQMAQVALVEGDLRHAYEGFQSAAFLMQAIKRLALAERCRLLYERIKYNHNRQESIKQIEELLSNYRLLKNQAGIAYSQHFLATLWSQQGDYVLAQEALIESAMIACKQADYLNLLTLLSDLALLCLRTKQSCQMAKLYALCRSLEERIGAGNQQLYLTSFELKWHRSSLESVQAHLHSDRTRIEIEEQPLSLQTMQIAILQAIASIGMMREVSH